MTIQDIALFKSYIESNTLREIFLRGYRKSVIFAKNPSSIEEFLINVEPENVITKAIRNFTTNSNYGYDFWQNASENWMVFLSQGRKRHSYTDYHKLIELDGMFKVLRENWDAAKAWLYEPVEVALLRLGLKEDDLEKEAKPGGESEEEVDNTDNSQEFNPSSVTNEKLGVDFSGVPEYDDEFEFFDLNQQSRTKSTRLKKDEASLNFRSHSFKLTFNQEVTKSIKGSGYKYVRLAKNKQGDIIIQLHKQQDSVCPVTITFASSSSSTNATINSKDLCEKLKTLLNLTGNNYYVLHVEILYQNIEKCNIKVTK